MTALLTLAIQHTLSQENLRRRVALAWTSLRLQHVLLGSRVVDDAETGKRGFAVDVPKSMEEAVYEGEKSVVWVEDVLGDVDVDEKEMYHHAYNVGRIVDPKVCMARLLVLPVRPEQDGTMQLRMLIVMGHQISDGLSAFNWFSHFIRILNLSEQDMEADMNTSRQEGSIKKLLPPAQEDLYPPISGSRARQRWFWAITRVLRHVKETLPPTFVNPLRREERLAESLVLEPKFDRLFDYSANARPPMSSSHVTASLSAAASARLMALCRAANVSIGAGCFALAGVSMMEIHESRYPGVPDAQRPAFSAGFPLNPRAFFANPPPGDSCMLSFSEGIVMPFLPARLSIEGRFKLVAKQANRELRAYQKRLKPKTGKSGIFDKHSPGRLLATGYLAQIERAESKLPLENKSPEFSNPQGSLLPKIGKYGATCGVSSLGSIASFFQRGRFDLESTNGKDFAADFRNVTIGVRARENEFLIGSSTNAEGVVGFGVSYDMNAISQDAAEIWAEKISGLLEKGEHSKL